MEEAKEPERIRFQVTDGLRELLNITNQLEEAKNRAFTPVGFLWDKHFDHEAIIKTAEAYATMKTRLILAVEKLYPQLKGLDYSINPQFIEAPLHISLNKTDTK